MRSMIPWFLNPWAEVRRLRESCFGLNRNWCDTLALLEECGRENEFLRRRIAEMDSRESGAENCRFHQSTCDLIQSLESNAKRQMTAEEIEIQRQNYARSFGKAES